jgi:tetraacyldisaccharide 4'-kinase
MRRLLPTEVDPVALSEPPWWYEAAPGLIQTLLLPVGGLYGRVAVRRYRRVVATVSRLPVICIGNFTAGGTGKTPLTEYVVGRLQSQGHRPCILTRGYGGRLQGPHWVDGRQDRAGDVGDEPLLLVASAPVLVARDRAEGARTIEASPQAFSHIVMDDGLQNAALRKSLALAVVDGQRGIGNGQVIPAGPLRAPLAFQMDLADAVIINHGLSPGFDATRVANLLPAYSRPILHARIAPAGDTAWLTPQPLVAFAGIGAPEHFFGLLRALGGNLVAAIPFGDHHAFTAQDANALLSTAAAKKALLVTTAKDHVRLAGQTGALADLHAQTRTVPIRMAIDPGDAAAFDRLLVQDR